MDDHGPERWSRIWRTLQEPMTWTCGIALLGWEALFRHGTDALVMSAALALIGGVSIMRLARKEIDDE